MSDLTGEIIDNRYELVTLIASGGMASIYKATDRRLDRFVAVKIMHPHLANDEEFVNRFIREAKAIAALSHPNIVSIQDQGWNEGGTPAVFIVMEYIDGFTLRDLLIERGPLSPDELLRYMIPVVSALAQAHNLGINHRDLKPENILISHDGRIKIADFGLARGGLLGNTMTVESSVVLGSVSYLSPEQVERGVSDARSDIYSLGVVLFELLTGRKPYDGDTPIQIAFKHVNERVPVPSTIRPGIPASLDAVILKATSPNPDQRQRNGAELLEELTKIQIELDPKKTQLRLDLDLPVDLPRAKRKPNRPEVRIGDIIVNRVKSFTEPNFIPTGKLEASPMNTISNSGAIRRKTSSRVKRNRIIALLVVLLVVGGGWFGFKTLSSGISIP
ncbi:MAG TPA: protein kinase, partial [Candidatus Nanopelagicaceae bacterium]